MSRLRGVLWPAAAVMLGLAACRSLRTADGSRSSRSATPPDANSRRRRRRSRCRRGRRSSSAAPNRAPAVRRVRFAGLDASKTYRLEFEDRRGQDRVLPASALMDEGVDVAIDGVGSEIVWFREIE